MKEKLFCAPYVRQGDTVRSMMSDVLIALFPAAVWAVYAFGFRALVIILTSLVSCAFIEFSAEKLLRKRNTLPNYSCLVTGLIFALTLPVGVPLYLVPLGAFLAIGIAKCAFGGLGKNIFNPALFAHGILYLLFPEKMSFFVNPFAKISPFSLSLSAEALHDALPESTLLAHAKEGILTDEIDFSALITGSVPGGMGMVSALLILAGLLYLLVRKITSWHIPFFLVGTVALLSFAFPYGLAARADFMLISLLSGGTLFAAVFLATDPTTSPMTTPGKILYGIFCGAALYLIRFFVGDIPAVAFALLIANLLSRLFDLPFRPRAFGTKRKILSRFRESFFAYLEELKKLLPRLKQKLEEIIPSKKA